jgi:acetolactate decarboxylase
VHNGELIITSSFDYKATLLVYCSVDKWNIYTIPKDVVSYESFETFVENKASKHGINTDEPFPFMIEGIAASFDWHVIDWKEGDTIHSHEKHKKSGLYGTENKMDVEMLGFYSKSHHAVFTHHSTNMHIHVKTNDDRISGHVDGFTLGPEMTLKLPDTK